MADTTQAVFSNTLMAVSNVMQLCPKLLQLGHYSTKTIQALIISKISCTKYIINMFSPLRQEIHTNYQEVYEKKKQCEVNPCCDFH